MSLQQISKNASHDLTCCHLAIDNHSQDCTNTKHCVNQDMAISVKLWLLCINWSINIQSNSHVEKINLQLNFHSIINSSTRGNFCVKFFHSWSIGSVVTLKIKLWREKSAVKMTPTLARKNFTQKSSYCQTTCSWNCAPYNSKCLSKNAYFMAYKIFYLHLTKQCGETLWCIVWQFTKSIKWRMRHKYQRLLKLCVVVS